MTRRRRPDRGQSNFRDFIVEDEQDDDQDDDDLDRIDFSELDGFDEAEIEKLETRFRDAAADHQSTK